MKIFFSILSAYVLTSSAFAASPADEQPGRPPYRCAGLIRTGRPGVNATADYGDSFQLLARAKADAIYRCRQTNTAQEGWGGLCFSWCLDRDGNHI